LAGQLLWIRGKRKACGILVEPSLW